MANNDTLTWDLSDVKDVSFHIPAGNYPAVLENLEITTSKNSGNLMMVADYMVTAGEYKERTLKDFMVLEGDGLDFSLPKIKRLVMAVTPDYDLTTFNPQTYVDEGLAKNKECNLEVAVRKRTDEGHEGEKQNNITKVLPAGTTGEEDNVEDDEFFD